MPEGIIKVGPGVEALPAAGHARRETLRKRAAKLQKVAETMLDQTELPIYAADPKKLKEEPEILRHMNQASFMFDVSNKKPGFVYFWCRDAHYDISVKKAESRMWLGPNFPGWEIVANCGCAIGSKHPVGSCEFPESRELIDVNGYRSVGDVKLMRIPLDSYERIQKNILLASRYKEANIPETMSDFIAHNKGLVKVVSGHAEPDELYKSFNQTGQRG